jgi:hypothetical protein
MRHLARTLALVALLACTVAPAAARADDWHSEQPLTPASPGGSGGIPAGLGPIGDIAFWAPNRGVLITASGLWAYDGTGWHQLSTVCGGTAGRIAWAGPLDFWTVSDQPIGQSLVDGGAHRSLCHFSGGAIVASYAQPIGTATSYEQMNAAACVAADDCWFGGERLSGRTNAGAFHLHWDGHTLSPVPSLTVRQPDVNDPSRAVGDLAVHQGALYESVRVDGNDVPGESAEQPFLLHQIIDGSSSPFSPVIPTAAIDYGGQPPAKLAPLTLTSDGGQLWAFAGTADTRAPIAPVALRLGPDGFSPVSLDDPQQALLPTTMIRDAAAEPGTDDAWVGYVPAADAVNTPARIARVHADGAVDSLTTLPTPTDGLSRKGAADRISCAAPGQCWVATSTGWLFHLGGSLPRDDDPAMHALITFRPLDASIPRQDPDDLPEDDSGLAPVFPEPLPLPETPGALPTDTPPAKRKPALVTAVKRRMLHRTTLELTFTLTAKAHVQLLAKRGKRTVAHTKRTTLAKGKHRLRLRLNTKRWPTKLDLRAEPLTNAKASTVAVAAVHAPKGSAW